MKRETVLSLIRVAGYHNDTAAKIRLYCENRVSYQVANAQFSIGAKQKAAGMRCDCYECKEREKLNHA